ncbi:MAG: cell division protein FtsW [Pseudomonadota bacterium]
MRVRTQTDSSGRGLVVHWGQEPFYLDTLLLVLTLAILLFGFVMVTSASLHLGEKMANDSFYFPKRQAFHIFAGLLTGGLMMRVPIYRLEQYAGKLFLAGLLLLVLVLIPGLGKSVNGSIRWLNLFGFRIQVSEVFKLMSFIYISSYITRYSDRVRHSIWGMIIPFGYLSVGAVLLLMEPDFGSTAVIMATSLGMFFLAGARMWQFIVLLGGLGGAAVILVMSASYRLKRVLSFMDPWADPLNSGFQLTQALIAFGRGEWMGVGLGSSVQKLFFLPEAHTDFLFSVIGEELGLAGAASVIIMFTLIVWRAFLIGRLAMMADRPFAGYLAYGIATWFGLQSFINMGVNMGLLPTKGLTLPLMSYGGGSMMVMCAALAILFRIRSESVEYFVGSARARAAWRVS